ncbi:MAG TPA: hypothetical protein VGB64_03040 [Actinomycetota bacterium]
MPPAGIIVLGLVQGSLAGLNSLGLVLLWRTMRLINLAQATLGLVGGVLVGLLVTQAGWSFWWAAPLGIAVGALLGLASERLVLRRLQDAPRVVLLIATIGLASLFAAIQTALPFIFGGRLPTYTIDLGFSLDLFPVKLLGPHLLALIVFPIALAATLHFVHRSRIGLAALALGQDQERARTLGVPAGVVRAAVWAVAGALASVSGILSIPVLGFNIGGGLGPTVLLLMLAPAVFAGLRSITGTAVAALALGVGYQLILWYTPRAGVADLALAGTVLAAVALQRRRLGRVEAATRASSWEAAASPRPVPWRLASLPGVQLGGGLFAVVAIVAASLPPLVLSASSQVRYATTAAYAIAALAVAVAWMFAGEVVLGHWGVAGLGAAVAALTPGPWIARALIAAAAMGATGAAMALASRRQASLSFAVLGLAAAAAAPSVLLMVGEHTVPADVKTVGMIGGGMAVAIAVALSRLRASVAGFTMVAARDDPQRAPWLGASVMRSRVIALSLSGALAGLAGALYLAATPAGIAPGAFDPVWSLDLLAMAVIGGLGSPSGALLGALAIRAARIFLPPEWAAVTSGAGVILVVSFLPGGLGRGLQWMRDRAVRVLAGPAEGDASQTPQAGAREAVNAT